MVLTGTVLNVFETGKAMLNVTEYSLGGGMNTMKQM